jgi:hypothetical protein
VDQRQVHVPEQVGKLVPAHLRQEPPAEEDVAARRDPRNVFAAAGHNVTSWNNAAQRHNLAAAVDKRCTRAMSSPQSLPSRSCCDVREA